VQGSKRGETLNVQKYEQKQNYQISTRRVLSEMIQNGGSGTRHGWKKPNKKGIKIVNFFAKQKQNAVIRTIQFVCVRFVHLFVGTP